MNEVIKEIIATYLIPALATFLTGFFTYIGAKIKAKYEEKVKNEEVREIVDKCVKYVEQKAGEMTSGEKYASALEKAQDWLQSKGIEISSVELDTLIESSVYALTGKEKK